MPSTRIRPNGVDTGAFGNYAVATGAATVYGAVNDQSDSSYVRTSVPRATPFVNYTLATTTISAGHDVVTVVPGLRYKKSTAAVLKANAGYTEGIESSATIYYGHWLSLGPIVGSATDAVLAVASGAQLAPTGVSWSQATIDSLQLMVADLSLDANDHAYIYEAYADVYTLARPTASVTITPSSPVTITSYPTFTVSVSALIESWQSSGLYAGGTFHLRIFTEEQYTAQGFDPSTSGSYWDAVQNFTALAYGNGTDPTVGNYTVAPSVAMPGTGNMRAYVRAKRPFQSAAWGEWDDLDFVMDLTPTQAPQFSAVTDPTNGRVALTVTPWR